MNQIWMKVNNINLKLYYQMQISDGLKDEKAVLEERCLLLIQIIGI